MNTAEETDPATPANQTQRHIYFNTVYDNAIFPPVVPKQPDMWYWDDWTPCQFNYIMESRLEQRRDLQFCSPADGTGVSAWSS